MLIQKKQICSQEASKGGSSLFILSFPNADIWLVHSQWRGHPVHFRMLSSIPGLYPLEASSNPHSCSPNCENQIVLRHRKHHPPPPGGNSFSKEFYSDIDNRAGRPLPHGNETLMMHPIPQKRNRLGLRYNNWGRAQGRGHYNLEQVSI